MKEGEPTTVARPLRTEMRTMPRNEGVSVDSAQQGEQLTVTTHRPCVRREVRFELRRTHAELENSDSGTTQAVGIFGALSIVGATATLVDAGSGAIGDTDENVRVYNPVGEEGALAIGGAWLALGAAASTVAIVDGARSAGAVDREETVEVPGRVLDEDVRCERSIPVSGVAVALRRKGAEDVKLGQTTAKGTLEVDLGDALAPSWTLTGPATAGLIVDGKAAGVVDIEPARVHHLRREGPAASRAWEALDKDCGADDVNSAACRGIRAFIAKYPWSDQADNAAAHLERVAEERRAATAKAEEEGTRAAEAKARAQAAAANSAAASAAAQQQHQQQAAACRQRCEAGCKSAAACVQQCVSASCGK